MKTFIKILIVQLCCLPLFVTDAMARDGDGKGKGNNGSRASVSRPSVRPSKSTSRNPITNSKSSRTEPKPANRPSTKPATRPSNKPQAPASRPANKPNVPKRPETKPAPRPNLPNRPDDKPSSKPNLPKRPETKPAQRPNLPDRPGDKPTTKPNRPNKPESRPETKPGNVNYPRPNKPVTLPGNVNRPGNNRPGDDRPNINRPNRKPEVKPGKNSRPIRKPQFDNKEVNINNKSGNKAWWSSNKNSNNRTTIVNNKNVYRGDTNVQINNNFKNNVNWSTNRKNWGYNPWWNRPATRPWYGGSWNCGWNNNYHRRHSHYYTGHYYGGYRPLPGYVVYEDHHSDVAEAIGWGLVGWSLGKLIFDSGYQTYSNPYPAQPVPSSKGSQVTYTQPITVVAAQTAPADEDAGKMTELSESYIATSQEFFKQRDYLKALDAANKAVGEAPGDGALHEYRALVLFALGKYSEAAGVLNPVLAGGPGWDWTTMVSLYNSQQTYMTQLESLENYSAAKPDAADARFLLGYHYMVCGYLDRATIEFAEAAKLQPADSVSAQLRDLTSASSNNGDEDATEDAEEAPASETPPPAEPVALEKLTGTWVSDKGAQGTVTLAFKDDGKFIWTFNKDDKSNEFGGDYSMNDNGLLVLDAEESQMVAAVSLPQDNELKFVLAGGPPGDPGLVFAKK